MGKARSLKITLTLWPSVIFVFLVTGLVGISSAVYSGQIKEESYAQVRATSEQTLANYEAYFSSSVVISEALLERVSSTPVEELPSILVPFFDDIVSVVPEIESLAVYRADDGSLIAKNASSDVEENASGEAWFQNALADRYVNFFNADSLSLGDPYSYTLSRYLPSDVDPSFGAVMKADFDFAAVVDGISSVDLGEGGRYLIYDADYRLIYSSLPLGNEEAMGLLKSLVIGESEAILSGHRYYLYAMTIASTGWRVAIFTNIDGLSNAANQFILTAVGLGFLSIAIFIAIMAFVANRVSNPLKLLQREMSRVASLDYQTNLINSSGGPSEVRDLYGSFEEMMSRIKELSHSLVKEKEEQRKSELRALQNQINPHFLYNTLDSIIALVDEGEGEEAKKMIVALSRFFRLSISRGHNVIPLKDELEHARNYLLIQKMRFRDAFSFEINEEVGSEGLYVVKLICQPILENALVHGLKEGETTHIVLRSYVDGSLLKIDISDDGYGMRESKKNELLRDIKSDKTFKGVGLKNVYSRLRIYYGEEADVGIVSQEDVGTTVTISIPLAKARHNDEGE